LCVPLKTVLNHTPGDTLIVHTGALGDVICALTAIDCFFSEMTIDFCCQGHIAPLLNSLNNIRNAFDINNPMMTSIFLGSNHSDIKDWLMGYSCIIIISFSKDWENSFHRYNQNTVRIPPRPPISETVHTSQFILNTLQCNNLISKNNSGLHDLILQKKTRSYKKSTGSQWKSVCIHPGSGSSFKNWPIEKYLALSKQLHQKGLSVGWILGPAEKNLMKLLIHHVNHKNIIQANNIQTIMHYLQQSGHFVGNDSGISHLSAYMGIDTTVLFGPSDVRRWRPIGACVKTIPNHFPVCSPCFEKGIRQCTHKKCLNDISVLQVIKMIDKT